VNGLDAATRLGMSPEEAAATVDALARRLPPSLASAFDASFVRSHALFDEFVYRLALGVVRETGLAEAARERGTSAEIAAQAGLDPGRSSVPVDWILRHLAGRGVLEAGSTGGGAWFRARGPVAALDPGTVLAEQRRLASSALAAYALAEAAARGYPAFLRGEASGEEILFGPARLPLWVDYFSNDNSLYAVNNRIAAAAVEEWLPEGPVSILELGGGLASGGAAVLDRLDKAGRLSRLREYRFTELVPAFLRRGQRTLQGRFPDAPFLHFGTLDMNRPFAEQGIAPGSFSLVHAVNTLHVAHDLAFTLGEVRRSLEPGGVMIASECVRPRPGQTLYTEFVFNLAETFRTPRLHPEYRPNGGFLTPEQWTAAGRAAGFTDVRLLPDVASLRDEFPTLYVAAVGMRHPP
jgi:SAM-dependent methyltransferase